MTIANALNRSHIRWTASASFLLYQYSILETYRDLDLMVFQGNIDAANSVLYSYGKQSTQYMPWTIKPTISSPATAAWYRRYDCNVHHCP
ncbi:MAG: hypothetical protein RRZ24_07155 [Clostridia bacterium]